MARYARVVVDSTARDLSRTFTYLVPDGLQVAPGHTVEVPFGPRRVAGYVVELSDLPGVELEKLRPIERILESEPIWGEELLRLAAWLRSFYGCTWQESLQTVVPAPVLARVRALPSRRVKRKAARRPAGLGEEVRIPSLSAEQERALQELRLSLEDGRPLLLLGITGSGKTEVYLRAAAQVLESGRDAIVMVPEVALTPQAVDRYRGRLGETVAVLHSGLTAQQRREQWLRLRTGEARLALGTRSAVFAPLGNLGLVVLDEEHDGSYKQDQAPRYHARQVAAWRCRQGGAAMVLGSATPSLESFYLAQRQHYRLAQLTRRAAGSPLPEVELIDMKRYPGQRRSLSPPLLARIREVTARQEQVVLLLNRRGFAPYLQCQECAFVVRCQRCSISLTYHRAPPRLACHYCLHEERVVDACPSCRGTRLDFRGSGTERLEEELREALPGLRVARMDRDTTSKAGGHAEILGRFASGEAQVLLGTQMVSKGLDFPRVTLVGVLCADQGLNLPDFRSAERTFQLLTQVAGRAGRAQLAGQVLVQAMDPEHPTLQAAARHDYLGFCADELEMRRLAVYPPFCRLLRVVLAGEEESAVARRAEELGRLLREQGLEPEQVVGPAPCPLARLRGLYRWHLLLKGAKVQDLMEIARKEIHAVRATGVVRIGLDPDPQSLL